MPTTSSSNNQKNKLCFVWSGQGKDDKNQCGKMITFGEYK